MEGNRIGWLSALRDGMSTRALPRVVTAPPAATVGLWASRFDHPALDGNSTAL
jgi:hypothetical protein